MASELSSSATRYSVGLRNECEYAPMARMAVCISPVAISRSASRSCSTRKSAPAYGAPCSTNRRWIAIRFTKKPYMFSMMLERRSPLVGGSQSIHGFLRSSARKRS